VNSKNMNSSFHMKLPISTNASEAFWRGWNTSRNIILQFIKAELRRFGKYLSAPITPWVVSIDVSPIQLPIVEAVSINQQLCGMIWEGFKIRWRQLEDGVLIC
jgi:hypothetical protein